MTQEEYEQEQREIESLINQINALIAENNRLVEEINNALHNIRILNDNIGTLQRNVVPVVNHVADEVDVNAEKTQLVKEALEELTERYFTFKNMSNASKNLSQYTDEYYTKFSNFHDLRRITLGYVIGLDTQFVTEESLRKKVEKVYLQNTEYWLAYAAAAMMLWASDEKEAAKRALDKALFMDQSKAALFFMLINLRFQRVKVAQEWFVYYMERIDASNLDEGWKYLLQAYLSGAFGVEPEFQNAVTKQLNSLFAKAEATTVDLGKKFSDRSYAFADTYLHQTNEHFSYLKRSCQDYKEMKEILSDAEKHEHIAQFYDNLANEKEEEASDIAQRIENVLYSLVNSYDDAEFEVVKKIKYNDAIMTAKGNVTMAQQKFEQEFGVPKKHTFGDWLVDWAFAEDNNLVPLMIRKFSITFMKDWIFKGYAKFAEDYRKKEKEAYTFDIDGCQVTCSEHEFDKTKPIVENFFEKNRWKHILADKFTLLYILMCVCGLITLGILLVSFSPIALTIGILLVLVGAFLLWRRIVELGAEIQEKKRLAVQKLQHCLQELGQWRELFHKADAKLADLENALAAFGRDYE
ncbi:MAG: hypothetical protein U0L12_03545 [Ruminococcus sp.]|nr:hypothetical protein [Ruminococcus sp.]